VDKVKNLEACSYIKILVEWRRVQDADNVGELSGKVVYVSSFYTRNSSPFSLGNVEINFEKENNERALLNKNNLIVDNEKSIKIYPQF